MALGFRDECFGTPLQIVFAPATEPVTDAVAGQVGASRARLVGIGSPFFDLTALVVEVVGIADELSCAGHGDVVVNVAVHTENSRILGKPVNAIANIGSGASDSLLKGIRV